MISLSVNHQDGHELYLDYQSGVGVTIITSDKKQIDFTIEPHEWETVKAFIDNQRAAELPLEPDGSPCPVCGSGTLKPVLECNYCFNTESRGQG